MDSKKLLVVGIDPGITTAYAVIDIDGNLLKLESSRQLELNRIISEAMQTGKIILVGTDKAKAPGLVGTFATKLGARLITPSEDLKVEDKRKLVSNYKFDDEHQLDALASALFAHKQTKPLLDKIDYFAEQNKKHLIKNKIKEIVITKKISIKSAASLIEKKDEDSKAAEKVIVEKKVNEDDFLKLYDKLRRYEEEIKIVKNYNNSLLKKLVNIAKAKKQPELKIAKPDFRDKRIRQLEKAMNLKNTELERIKLAIRRLNSVLTDIDKLYILKKLQNLGISEFNLKNNFLNIKRNDILLVDDPNIVSDKTVEMLEGKVFLIVCRKPINKKIENSLPFVFLSSKNLKLHEEKHFAFVEKNQLDEEKNKIDWVKKIVDDYRKEKQLLNP